MKHLLFAISLAMPLPALAQTDHSGHQMPSDQMTDGQMAGDQSPASLAFAEANARMHAEMAVPLTGNADVDFIAGMIPHHQGAVDMARIVLEHGTDPEVRALAQTVITAQEAEITWMTEWLAKQAK
jgi:uncharacterized protein (DUF305 family)